MKMREVGRWPWNAEGFRPMRKSRPVCTWLHVALIGQPPYICTDWFCDSERVFVSTTRVKRVSSDNANIAAEHQEPAEVLSQLGNTSIRVLRVTLHFMGSTSVASVAASGVLVASSGVVCDSSLFSLEISQITVSKNYCTDIWRCPNEEQLCPW